MRIIKVILSAYFLCYVFTAFAATPTNKASLFQKNNKKWIAGAGIEWFDSDGAPRVVVAVGEGSTPDQAIREALQLCSKNSGQQCALIGTDALNHGCIYISTGADELRAQYFASTTSHEALQLCYDEIFYDCGPLVVTCVHSNY